MNSATGSTVTPFLWFEHEAEAAARHYVALLPNSRITQVRHGVPATADAPARVMSVEFELDGHPYIAFNGGPHFRLNESFSLFVSCANQDEVDHYWQALIADGGSAGRCGWLKDRFGVSWQIIPTDLGRLLGDPDRERAGRALQSMFTMQKIDIAALHAAAAAAPGPDPARDSA